MPESIGSDGAVTREVEPAVAAAAACVCYLREARTFAPGISHIVVGGLPTTTRMTFLRHL